MKENLNREIDAVICDKNTVKQLIENQIERIYELCQYSRMELVEKGLNNTQINNIIVALQLQGVDLKPNHAKKNALLDS